MTMNPPRKTANDLFKYTKPPLFQRATEVQKSEPKPSLQGETGRAELAQKLERQAGEGFVGWVRRTSLDRKRNKQYEEVIDAAIRSSVEIDLLEVKLTTESALQRLRDSYTENAVASSGPQLCLQGMLKLEVEAMLTNIEQSIVQDRRSAMNRVLDWHAAGDVTDDERDEHLSRMSSRYRARAEEVRELADEMIARIKALLQRQ